MKIIFLPNVKIVAALVAGLLVGLNGSVGAITIAHNGDSVDLEFVDIGSVGNAGQTYVDSRGNTQTHGAVDYEYSIGKFAITADQWAVVAGFDALVENTSNDSWTGSQPTANTSWYEAVKFANWLTSGNALQGAYTFSGTSGADNTFTGVDRATALTTYGTIYVLPSEDEWYKAAYFKSDGSGYTTYAIGDGLPVEGTDANYNNANTAPWDVGSGTAENNGTYDMGGNLYEWGESAFDGTLDDLGENRILRGGFWTSDSSFLLSSDRNFNVPRQEIYAYGFRVASISVVPEPSSVGLLALGAMGCMLRRRRN